MQLLSKILLQIEKGKKNLNQRAWKNKSFMTVVNLEQMCQILPNLARQESTDGHVAYLFEKVFGVLEII